MHLQELREYEELTRRAVPVSIPATSLVEAVRKFEQLTTGKDVQGEFVSTHKEEDDGLKTRA